MVVVDVDQHAAVEAERGGEAGAAAIEGGIVVGEGVEAPVQPEAAGEGGRPLGFERPLDEVAGEGAEAHQWLLRGEVEMDEVVHVLILPLTRRRAPASCRQVKNIAATYG